MIIETSDALTHQIINTFDMPEYMQIIKVPFNQPISKPKALNYAMNFINGEYITIYNAEDRPAKDQFITTLNYFNILPEKYICVQCTLGFF